MSPSARSMAVAPNDTHPHPALRATFPLEGGRLKPPAQCLPLGEGGTALAVTDEGDAIDI